MAFPEILARPFLYLSGLNWITCQFLNWQRDFKPHQIIALERSLWFQYEEELGGDKRQRGQVGTCCHHLGKSYW